MASFVRWSQKDIKLNIFVLDRNPAKAARQQMDKHVVKMVLETAQMLCSALHRYKCSCVPYKQTHINHPCTLWAGETSQNYLWLCYHGLTLAHEYMERYNKKHKSTDVILWCYYQKHHIPKGPLTAWAQAMPVKYKHVDPVIAYRQYYRAEKADIATWKRNKPEWWNNL